MGAAPGARWRALFARLFRRRPPRPAAPTRHPRAARAPTAETRRTPGGAPRSTDSARRPPAAATRPLRAASLTIASASARARAREPGALTFDVGAHLLGACTDLRRLVGGLGDQLVACALRGDQDGSQPLGVGRILARRARVNSSTCLRRSSRSRETAASAPAAFASSPRVASTSIAAQGARQLGVPYLRRSERLRHRLILHAAERNVHPRRSRVLERPAAVRPSFQRPFGRARAA